MSSNLTKIQPEKFAKIAEKVGLTVERQPSQFKISVPGKPALRFYVPGQKLCHKVELSGHSHERAVEWSVLYPKSPPSKKITHVLDFRQDERSILRDFYLIARDLMGASLPETLEEPASSPAPVEPLVANS